MGVYCYTARAGYKTVDGIDIARYAYSYKTGWDAERSPTVQRKLAAGERAAEKLNAAGVKHFIMGDYDYAREYGEIFVYECNEHSGAHYDGGNWPGKPVGRLIPMGARGLKFVKE